MIGIVIQVAGLAIGVSFLIYLINTLKQEKNANQGLLTTIAVLGFGVFLAGEVLTIKIDAANNLTGAGLLWTVYQLAIKIFGSAKDKVTYVPQMVEFVRVYVTPKMALAAAVVVQLCGQVKFYFAA